MLQKELFGGPLDVAAECRAFADVLYDYEGEMTRDGLAFRVELFARELLAQGKQAEKTA